MPELLPVPYVESSPVLAPFAGVMRSLLISDGPPIWAPEGLSHGRAGWGEEPAASDMAAAPAGVVSHGFGSFDVDDCAVCHGLGGEGDDIVPSTGDGSHHVSGLDVPLLYDKRRRDNAHKHEADRTTV